MFCSYPASKSLLILVGSLQIFPLLQNFDQFTLAEPVNSFSKSNLFIDSELLLLVLAVMVELVVLIVVVVLAIPVKLVWQLIDFSHYTLKNYKSRKRISLYFTSSVFSFFFRQTMY